MNTALPAILMAWITVLAVSMAWAGQQTAQPLSLHPDNPRYLLFRGRPTVLITSGEHYGAVLNLDFDYVKYLDAIQAAGFNLTRTFSGTYREVPGSFGITDNPLGPKRFQAPWARSDSPGAWDGGNKFDLKRFDPAYFARLKDFMAQASRRGIVVEFVLFCPFYDDKLWEANPMNAKNNVNGIGNCKREEVYTLKYKDMLAIHEAFVRRVVEELNEFDNLYYEICNEPYFGGVTLEWQERIAQVIAETEAALPHKHLIAQNIANGSKKIEKPNPLVSIFNFHYCTPPDAVEMNYHLKKVIADDETGFKGREDVHYRTEGWDFIIAGGGIYSNLDYSFTTGHPDGTLEDFKSPGGGGKELRKQLRILKDFIEGFDFVRMSPQNGVIKGGVATGTFTGTPASVRITARCLAEKGRAYAIYVRGGSQAELAVELPAGTYRAQWVNTRSGAVDRDETFDHAGGTRKLVSPAYVEDIALRIVNARNK